MENDWKFDRPPSALELVQNNVFSNFLRTALHVIVRLSFLCYHRFQTVHPERLEGIQSKIIAANHSSHLDVLALFSAFPLKDINRIRTFAAKDYFFKNPFLRCVGFFFANVIPIDRQGWSAESLSYAGRALAEGGIFIIFPEGTRSVDGEIHSFRPGIGMLALHYGVAMVPVYIDGTFSCQKKGDCFPKPHKIRIIVGTPIDFSHLENNRQSWETITSALELRIKNLKEEIKHV
ncbi:MAG TPA: lysophospholipid acyltransferase family protein [Candidatus Omnitrophota bacterium]|jgi:1-acyl-sn-glycerol-3-phosphate acyltransferase|nr:lysophospholipid acyltransferase family protein [Candidatus Omnitrophota bacterium]HPN56784.1 lysophospholipid acyltransferase family protein [Candidatus Omnitrophota bacterium]